MADGNGQDGKPRGWLAALHLLRAAVARLERKIDVFEMSNHGTLGRIESKLDEQSHTLHDIRAMVARSRNGNPPAR